MALPVLVALPPLAQLALRVAMNIGLSIAAFVVTTSVMKHTEKIKNKKAVN